MKTKEEKRELLERLRGLLDELEETKDQREGIVTVWLRGNGELFTLFDDHNYYGREPIRRVAQFRFNY